MSCVFAISSTAIDEGIEFRISGTRGQHHEIGCQRRTRAPTGKGGSAMVPLCGGTKAGGASSCASPSQSSSEILDDGGDQSRLEVDKALARGRQTLQIETKLSISIGQLDI